MTDTPSSTILPPEADSKALVPVQDASQGSGKRRCCRVVFFIVLLFCLALVASAWFAYQQWQMQRAQWSAQLTQSQASAEAARSQTQRALTALQTQTALLDKLQADQARTATQLQSLEHVVEAITTATTPAVGSDAPAMLLSDTGRLVDMAQQSLRLTGDVSAALMALESAHARLIGHDEFVALAQALQDDIERLRDVPVTPVALLASRLDEVSTLLAQAPLLLPESLPETAPEENALVQGMTPHAADASSAAVDTASTTAVDTAWWRTAWHQTQTWSQHAWQSIAQDLRGLIDVRRVDDATALLISPHQAAMLRDTLQYRVAAARLALLMRQPTLWASELSALQAALDARFDHRQAQVVQAQALLRTLRQTAITVELPTLDGSVRAVQTQRERWSRAQQDAASTPASEDADALTTDGERN